MKGFLCLILFIGLTGCGYDEEAVHQSTTELLKRNLTSELINENTIESISYYKSDDKVDTEYGRMNEYSVYIYLNDSMSNWNKCEQWDEIVRVTNLLEGKIVAEGTRFEGIYEDVNVKPSYSITTDSLHDIKMNVYGVAEINYGDTYDEWLLSHYDELGNPVYSQCMYQ